jgi:hypothetical protein
MLALSNSGLKVTDMTMAEPSLEDVFLSITGQNL